MAAKATQTKSEDGMVFLDVTAPGTSFGVQMIGCDPKGAACHAMALFTVFDRPASPWPSSMTSTAASSPAAAC